MPVEKDLGKLIRLLALKEELYTKYLSLVHKQCDSLEKNHIDDFYEQAEAEHALQGEITDLQNAGSTCMKNICSRLDWNEFDSERLADKIPSTRGLKLCEERIKKLLKKIHAVYHGNMEKAGSRFDRIKSDMRTLRVNPAEGSYPPTLIDTLG